MNIENMHQIFDHYIDRFSELNEKHSEFYKWQVAFQFHTAMDEALNASDDDFAKKLLEVKNLTINLIDNYTSPFYGLCKFAQFEPATVREMFTELYQDTDTDTQERMNRFIAKSIALRDKYFPGSFLYTDDPHSVTGYLFFYDPDRYYFFKARNCNNFADCISFPESWGSGKNLDLKTFAKMYDWVVSRINEYPKLLEANQKRYDGRFANSKYGNELHPDSNKHILVFDLIYCCTVYNLFDGITFERRRFIREDKEFLRKQSRALLLQQQLSDVQKKIDIFADIESTILSHLKPEDPVIHKSFGIGTVNTINNSTIIVDFTDAETKKFSLLSSFAGGFLRSEDPSIKLVIENNKEILSDYNSIINQYNKLNSSMEGFKGYLPE